MGHELCDEHGVYVLYGDVVQCGHLYVGHEHCDEHDGNVLGRDIVQCGHLCVGHELSHRHGRHVLWGDSLVGFVRTFRWDFIYRWSAKCVVSCFTTTTTEPAPVAAAVDTAAASIEHHERDLTTIIEHHECDLTINIEHYKCDLVTATVTTTSIIATPSTSTPTQQGDFRW